MNALDKKKNTNALLANTQSFLTALSNYAEQSHLTWGTEEKMRADSALGQIDTLLRDNGITWGDILADQERKNNVTTVVKQVVFLKLNPDAVPREVYFQLRSKRVGEDKNGKAIYKQYITSGVEGAGNDTLLREFGVKVKDVMFYIVHEGDEFTGVWYDGFDVKLPTFKPKKRALGESKGKAMYAVYLIETTDGKRTVSMAEREDVKSSLLAAIRQNGRDNNNPQIIEDYIAELYPHSLDDILDGKVPNKEFKKETKRWDKIQRKWVVKTETITLNQLIGPAWNSLVSREQMLIRKMRNKATQNYTKNFGNKVLQELYEGTFEDEDYRKKDSITADIVDVDKKEIEFSEQSGSIELDEFVEVDLEVEDEFVDESYFSDDDVAFEVETDDGLVFAPEFESVENAKLAEKQQKESEQDDFNETVPNWMSLD